ncbi:MAG: hypothetical protein GF330_12625, partial [Candidatus Eisenbacteria bacterium]|nr:hypothetical protein [Candidatus Eisenbacteria bacterium]
RSSDAPRGKTSKRQRQASSARPRATSPRRRSAKPRDVVKGRLRPHDPFELIRWVAFSQTDPRKAVAELVQNSLDADAARIHLRRFRQRRVPCLRIFDNGQGVIPEMDRPDALKYIATHIGHSRKRSLSPRERLELMTQGRYGIGLLGFWCLGEALEMRSSVPGQRAHRLVLYRDKPNYLIEPLRGSLDLGDRWTEIIISDLHPEASRILLGRRMADYLGAELRGQLMVRAAELLVEDRMARGTAQKKILVRPRRFLGERLEGIGPLEVPGHAPIHLELYYRGDGESAASASTAGTPGGADAPGGRGEGARGGARDPGATAEDPGTGPGGGIAVYCAGTLVAEGFHELAGLGLDRAPWTDPRLTGLVDFPGFNVAPGTRRGVIPDEAAAAFAQSLGPVETLLNGLLETYERRRVEAIDRALIRDLQRAFRHFYRHRPSYSMLPVREERDLGAGPGATDQGAPGATGGGAGEGEGAPGEGTSDSAEAGSGETPAADATGALAATPVELLPPGPLASVRITPSVIRIQCGGQRRIRARALDATGRPLEARALFAWALVGPVGALRDVSSDGAATGRATLAAAREPVEGSLVVRVNAGGREAAAEVPVAVLAELPGKQSAEGIPEPELLDLPGEPWRSRMVEGRWQVNSGHRDYRSVAEQQRPKLRYLAMLFAKEVVLRSRQDPRLALPLEQMVEVLSYADQRLSMRGRRGGGAKG